MDLYNKFFYTWYQTCSKVSSPVYVFVTLIIVLYFTATLKLTRLELGMGLHLKFSLYRNHWTRVEVTDTDKHTSLLRNDEKLTDEEINFINSPLHQLAISPTRHCIHRS
jgi:hypothetical protein